ncbi:hypothetical protein [Gemmobacter sp. LW-1]|uniref:hypothetical protein n=1 Tax=Gemmobacter sp. LW-1 TaxID=1529005 RepID=UPI0006C772D6|nr:hypothetical protein [Gemmobacter sp. LW-1]
MSHTKAFDRAGRGRGAVAARRISVPPVITRHAATAFWADLVARRCASREECAVMFGVTFQTSCNWHDGFSCPTGDKVMMAMRMWPEEFTGGGDV